MIKRTLCVGLLAAFPLSGAAQNTAHSTKLLYVPESTWQKSADDPALQSPLVLKIMSLAENAPGCRKDWKEIDWDADKSNEEKPNGLDEEGNLATSSLPLGYVQGLSLSFARSYARLLRGEKIALDTTRDPVAGDLDVLYHYRKNFAALLPTRAGSAAAANLRHLYTFMVDAGKLESDGAFCDGADSGNATQNGRTTEAGFIQTSYDITDFPNQDLVRGIATLTEQYSQHPERGWLQVFHRGLRLYNEHTKKTYDCPWGKVERDFYGTGEARKFQELSRMSPAFAAEVAALSLRFRADQYRTAKIKNIEIRPACDELFFQIQQLVDETDKKSALLLED